MVLGRIDAGRDDYDLAKFGAWQAEWFRRQEALKPFGEYAAPAERSDENERQSAQEMLASMVSKASQGAPITVELVDAPRRKGV